MPKLAALASAADNICFASSSARLVYVRGMSPPFSRVLGHRCLHRVVGYLGGVPYRTALVRHSSRVTAHAATECGIPTRTRTRKPESLQHGLQRRSLDAEPGGGSPGPCDDPVRLVERARDKGALGAFERLALLGRTLRHGFRRHPRQREAPTRREDYGALDHILELADISGPRVATEYVERLRGNHIDAAVHAAGKLRDEVVDERLDVVASFPEGWDRHREYVQAIVEILTEELRSDHFGEISIGRRDDAHVGLERLCPAETFEFVLLQHAEELWLHLQGHLADLVEEQRAAVGELEASDPLCGRAGEGAAFVAEQLALEQGRRNGGAVELHERPSAPTAGVVNRAGNQLLSCSGLSEDEDGRVSRRHDLDQLQYVAKTRATPDDRPRADALDVNPRDGIFGMIWRLRRVRHVFVLSPRVLRGGFPGGIFPLAIHSRR